jgi:hypothetical protein
VRSADRPEMPVLPSACSSLPLHSRSYWGARQRPETPAPLLAPPSVVPLPALLLTPPSIAFARASPVLAPELLRRLARWRGAGRRPSEARAWWPSRRQCKTRPLLLRIKAQKRPTKTRSNAAKSVLTSLYSVQFRNAVSA